MGVPAIFRDLIRAGVSFETDGERLRWRNSGGLITPPVIEALKSHKADILDFLKSRPEAEAPAPSRQPGDRPTTWTGRVVSLDEWRRLSEWDRHGPNGRLWCGICRDWVHGFPYYHRVANQARITASNFDASNTALLLAGCSARRSATKS